MLAKKTSSSLSPTLASVIGFPKVPVYGKCDHGFDFDFVMFLPEPEPETLDTDIMIIGSVYGGRVCAKNLAEAGYRVIVVDKAYHYPSSHFLMEAGDAGIHPMENGGALSLDDGGMGVLVGSTWGGGGTINWSASLQLQGYVRQEWADAGLPFYTSAEFQKSIDRVCERMGCSTEHIRHNFANRHTV